MVEVNTSNVYYFPSSSSTNFYRNTKKKHFKSNMLRTYNTFRLLNKNGEHFCLNIFILYIVFFYSDINVNSVHNPKDRFNANI